MPSCAGLPDFAGATYQNGVKVTKWPQKISNGHETYKMVVHTYNIPNGHKIYQHCPFRGRPKCTQTVIFLFWKYTIWQPCVRRHNRFFKLICFFSRTWSNYNFDDRVRQCNQIGRNFATWAILFGVGRNFSNKLPKIHLNMLILVTVCL
jgi:hypothetical protein